MCEVSGNIQIKKETKEATMNIKQEEIKKIKPTIELPNIQPDYKETKAFSKKELKRVKILEEISKENLSKTKEEQVEKNLSEFDSKKEYINHIIKDIKATNKNDINVVNQPNENALDEKQQAKLEKKKQKRLKEIRKSYPLADEDTLSILEGSEQYTNEQYEKAEYDIKDISKIYKKFEKEYIAQNYLDSRRTLDYLVRLAANYKKDSLEEENPYLELVKRCKEAFESGLEANGLKIEYGENERLVPISEEGKQEAVLKNQTDADNVLEYGVKCDYLQKKKEVDRIMNLYSNWKQEDNKQELNTVDNDTFVIKKLKEKRAEVNPNPHSEIIKKIIEGKRSLYKENKKLTDNLYSELVKLEKAIEQADVQIQLFDMQINGFKEDEFELKGHSIDTEEGLFYNVQKQKNERRIKVLEEKINNINGILENIYNKKAITEEQNEFMKKNGYIADKEVQIVVNDKNKLYNNALKKAKEENNHKNIEIIIKNVISSLDEYENLDGLENYHGLEDLFYVANFLKDKGTITYIKTPMNEYEINKILICADKARAIMLIDAYNKNCLSILSLTEEEKVRILKGKNKEISEADIERYAKSEYIKADKKLEDIKQAYFNKDETKLKWDRIDINGIKAEEVNTTSNQYKVRKKESLKKLDKRLEKEKYLDKYDKIKDLYLENIEEIERLDRENKVDLREKDKVIRQERRAITKELRAVENKFKLLEKQKDDIQKIGKLRKEIEKLEEGIKTKKKNITIFTNKANTLEKEENAERRNILLEKAKHLEDNIKRAKDNILGITNDINQMIDKLKKQFDEKIGNAKDVSIEQLIIDNKIYIEYFDAEYKEIEKEQNKYYERIDEKDKELEKTGSEYDKNRETIEKIKKDNKVLEKLVFTCAIKNNLKIDSLEEINELDIFNNMEEEEFLEIISKLSVGMMDKMKGINDNPKNEKVLKEGIEKYKELMKNHYNKIVRDKYHFKFPSFEQIEKNYEEIIRDCRQAEFDKDIEIQNIKVLNLNSKNDIGIANDIDFCIMLKEYVMEYQKLINDGKGFKEYNLLREKYQMEFNKRIGQ